MSKTLLIKPRVSEKAYALSEERNTYIFEIPVSANRLTVAKAVAEQYEVGVKKVRIAAAPGKTKRTYRRGGRITHKASRSGFRKAYVTLNEGDNLPIFAAMEDNNDKPDLKEGK